MVYDIQMGYREPNELDLAKKFMNRIEDMWKNNLFTDIIIECPAHLCNGRCRYCQDYGEMKPSNIVNEDIHNPFAQSFGLDHFDNFAQMAHRCRFNKKTTKQIKQKKTSTNKRSINNHNRSQHNHSNNNHNSNGHRNGHHQNMNSNNHNQRENTSETTDVEEIHNQHRKNKDKNKDHSENKNNSKEESDRDRIMMNEKNTKSNNTNHNHNNSNSNNNNHNNSSQSNSNSNNISNNKPRPKCKTKPSSNNNNNNMNQNVTTNNNALNMNINNGGEYDEDDIEDEQDDDLDNMTQSGLTENEDSDLDDEHKVNRNNGNNGNNNHNTNIDDDEESDNYHENTNNINNKRRDKKKKRNNNNNNNNNNNDYCLDDTMIMNDTYCISAHKSILSSVSLVFHAMLNSRHKEVDENRIIINDLCFNTMYHLLSYSYTNQVENNWDCDLKALFAAAEKYQIYDLCHICLEKMENLITVDSVCDLLVFIQRYQDNHHLNRDLMAKFETNLLGFMVENYPSISKMECYNKLKSKIESQLTMFMYTKQFGPIKMP